VPTSSLEMLNSQLLTWRAPGHTSEYRSGISLRDSSPLLGWSEVKAYVCILTDLVGGVWKMWWNVDEVSVFVWSENGR
jgi:hypothetical protein